MCESAPDNPAARAVAARTEARNRYALAAALWELWPCEATLSLRLAALVEVVRARCADGY
jgi:hypothetical protein